MAEISLTDFVDFVISSGTTKLAKIRALKKRPKYDPKSDFWKPLREVLVEYSKNGSTGMLDTNTVLDRVKDQKKIKLYPSRIDGFNKFKGRKNVDWFQPPGGVWEFGGLRIRVNPELGLKIGGKAYVVKLYFKQDTLSISRVAIIQMLLKSALHADLESESEVAILDVQKGRLFSTSEPDPSLLALLQSEANGFEFRWARSGPSNRCLAETSAKLPTIVGESFPIWC